MKANRRVQYQDKATLQSFLRISREIPLNGFTVFTFIIHALLGAGIIPLTMKLVIETVAMLAQSLLFEYSTGLAAFFESFLVVFQYVQWPLSMLIIAVYWFRCNVKAYNYRFTQNVGAKIRRQLSESSTVFCPRCGEPMQIKRFTETVSEQTGEHKEYYTEWVNFGRKDSYTIRHTEIVPDYSDVEYERQYAVCSNRHCMYADKRPFRSAFRTYKFSEMPYKISDTINYAVRTKATTNDAAGNIRQYAHGMPLIFYYIISQVMLFLYAAINSVNASSMGVFAGGLILCEIAVLIGGAIVQVATHLRNPRRDDDYVEFKNRTKDGVTVVLPDGSEFYAQTDHKLQRMYDEYRRALDERERNQ